MQYLTLPIEVSSTYLSTTVMILKRYENTYFNVINVHEVEVRLGRQDK